MPAKRKTTETKVPDAGRVLVNVPTRPVTEQEAMLAVAQGLRTLAYALNAQPAITITGCHVEAKAGQPGISVALEADGGGP